MLQQWDSPPNQALGRIKPIALCISVAGATSGLRLVFLKTMGDQP